jgi:hypothetical protein
MYSPTKRNTDLECPETFEKEFLSGVPERDSQTGITPDAPLFEVAVCGKPWKRETQTTYGQLCPA